MKNFDDVNGIIIGGFSCKVVLFDPNGCSQISKIVPADSDFKAIAEDMKEKVLDVRLGNGKRMKDCPSMINQLHGQGEWQLKMFNF